MSLIDGRRRPDDRGGRVGEGVRWGVVERFPPGQRWVVGDADLPAAAERMVASGRTGALVRVQARERIDGESTVRAAWQATLASLPAGSIAMRTAWADFDAVAQGDEPALCAIGATLLRGLLEHRTG